MVPAVASSTGAALLAAMLVEEGKLRWDSTVAEIFPELVERMDPGLRKVTLTQLLSHTSGVAPDNQAAIDLIEKADAEDGNLDELRYSAGVGLTWYTGFGPMTFSLAKPLNAGDFDEEEVFQFTLGRGF